MNKTLIILASYISLTLLNSCVTGIYKEKGEQAKRTFVLNEQGPVKISIQTPGSIKLMGSVPGKIVWESQAIAWAGSQKRALELANKSIAFSLTPDYKSNEFIGKTIISDLSVGEKAYLNVNVLLPLERPVAASIGMSYGPLEVLKMKGSLIVRSGTPSEIKVYLFEGVFNIKTPGGIVTLSGKFTYGNLNIGNGDVTLRQEGISQDKDININLKQGNVYLETRSDYLYPIEIIANSIENKSDIKFSSKQNHWQRLNAQKGPGIKIKVLKGNVTVLPRIIKSFKENKN